MLESIEKTLYIPIAGRIKLGELKEHNKGSYRPSNVIHFNLEEAPEVQRVYGDNPEAIHVNFYSHDRKEVLETYLAWFSGGGKDSLGKPKGGNLICRGDEVKAYYHDIKAGEKKERACLGEECPDYFGPTGLQQCHQRLRIKVILPRVSPIDVYEIYSNSFHNMKNLNSFVKHYAAHPDFTRMVFKMTREERETIDKGQKKRFIIVKLDRDPSFMSTYLEEMKQAEVNFSQTLLPSSFFRHENMKALSMAEEEAPVENMEALPSLDEILNHVADDPELLPYFDQISALKGTTHDHNKRFQMVLYFKNEQDPKAATMAYLKTKIEELNAQIPQDTGAQPQ